MPITTSLQLKLNPSTGTYKTGDWLDISGSNFGGAPSVVLFDPIHLVEGQQIRLNSPKVGVYTDISSNARAVAENGEFWLPSRDPTQVSSTSENRVTLGFETSPFAQFFWFHRTMGKSGLKFPFATAAGLAPVWADTNMKPWWFTTSGNGNEVDQVLPNYNTSGLGCFGNTTAISKDGNPADANGYPRQTDMFVTKPTGLGFYQSGDESAPGALDATINIQRYDDAGFTEKTFTADPFKVKDATNFPILGNSEYFRLQWMSMTNPPSGGWSNVQMLTNWMYLATGAFARAAIFLGDAPTLAGCKDPRPFFPDLWTGSRIVIDKMGFSGYVHHRHADGTVQNNIMGGIV